MNIDKIVEHAHNYINTRGSKPFQAGRDYITASGQYFDGDDVAALVRCALEQWYAEGKYSQQFEKDLIHYYSNTIRHVVLTNSGSSANLLAITAITDPLLKSKQAKPGDEVITVAAGFPTTVAPILQNGLVPVFVDVNLNTFTPDLDVIENAIVEGKTKAVILAHPLGNLYDLEALREICDEYSIYLIEDACDALGGTFNGQLAGSFGDLSTFSFYPAHHITAGEGGAVLVRNNPLLEKIVKSFRDWGRDCWCEPGKDNTCGRRFSQRLGDLPQGYDHKYTYSRVGYNLKATDLQASLLVSQLKKLPYFVDIRRRNWRYLRENLDKYHKYFRFQEALPGADPSWFGFALTVRGTAPFTRTELASFLEANKVGTRNLFAGNLIRHPGFAKTRYRVFQDLSNSDVIMNSTFWIGVHPSIGEEQLEYMIKTFDKFLEGVQ